MIVVLDTGVLYGDLLFANANARILLSHSGAETFRIAMPAAVVLEHEKRLRKQIEPEYSRLVGSARELGRRGIDIQVPRINVDVRSRQIHRDVVKRLGEEGVEFPPNPDGDHSEFARRSVAELKPWGDRSRGYRDALIWETVKDFAAEESVVLATTNSDDFCDPDNDAKLHSDLIDDLQTAGIPANRVGVLSSIADVVDALVPPDIQARERLEQRLREDFNFYIDVQKELETLLFEAQIEPWDSVTISDFDVPIVDVDVVLTHMDSHRLVSAHALDDDEPNAPVIVTFFADAFVRFEFTSPRAAEPYLRNDRELVVTTKDGWALAETEWRPVLLVAQATYDPSTRELSDWSKASLADRDDDSRPMVPESDLPPDGVPED